MTTKDARIGKRGSAEIQWTNGRTTTTEGVVIWINEAASEVYLETSLGNVVGNLDTLEMDEVTE